MATSCSTFDTYPGGTLMSFKFITDSDDSFSSYQNPHIGCGIAAVSNQKENIPG